MTLREAIARYEGYGASPTNRPTRNNNPGNLRYAGQRGAIGADAQGFAIFPTAAAGWEALDRQIALDASRGDTLATFLADYAPSSENNTSRYLSTVAGWLGVGSNTSLRQLTAGSPAQTPPAAIAAQAQHEEVADPLTIAAAIVGAAALFTLI